MSIPGDGNKRYTLPTPEAFIYAALETRNQTSKEAGSIVAAGSLSAYVPA